MRALLSILALSSLSLPAFADVVIPGQVPEPETAALFGIAAAALFLAKRLKK